MAQTLRLTDDMKAHLEVFCRVLEISEHEFVVSSIKSRMEQYLEAPAFQAEFIVKYHDQLEVYKAIAEMLGVKSRC